MLCDIISEALTGQPDIEVVGGCDERMDLARASAAEDTDVIVLGLQDAEFPEAGVRLFDAHPQLHVLGVAADGRRAFLYELRPHRTALGEVSPQGLVDAIRVVAGPRAL